MYTVNSRVVIIIHSSYQEHLIDNHLIAWDYENNNSSTSSYLSRRILFVLSEKVPDAEASYIFLGSFSILLKFNYSKSLTIKNFPAVEFCV